MFASTIEISDVTSRLRAAQPLLWLNPGRTAEGLPPLPNGTSTGPDISFKDTERALARFSLFQPVMQALFPELQATGGVVESALLPVPALQAALGLPPHFGRLMVKADHSLPVAGSIKARGGIHEVLELAETLALQHGLLQPGADDYTVLASPAARALFSQYQVAVGSTGNLGLSIGVMASALGFQVAVHMSADAKDWKKERLRQRGVTVVEHPGDYAEAVAAGRQQAEGDAHCHFVDDESSLSLFLGYSAAAVHLLAQLAAQQITVDATHPLFVYLPCGVGGAPGGIAFGLAHLFGRDVHCFFAEPTQSPCFLIEMMAAPGSHPSVYDLGLNNRTEADGLAVPRASELAATVMRPVLSGVFTVEDDTLFRHLHLAADTAQLRLEPSAAAGFSGPAALQQSHAGQQYLAQHGLQGCMHQATHVVWTTGGLFVPDVEYARFAACGAALHDAAAALAPWTH